MPWIENSSFDDVRKAWHFDPGPNGMLISIVDPDMENPEPKYPFKERHCFKFLDLDEPHALAMQDSHASGIADLLKHAKANNMNVVVHCVAGICRSGAVVEAAVACLGFTDPKKVRMPNTRVKAMLMEKLS